MASSDPFPRVLHDEDGLQYVQLSAQYGTDVYYDPAFTYTVATFSEDLVMLDRLKSNETAICFRLSKEEMTALVTGYTAYLTAQEQAQPARTAPDPLPDLDDHPF